MINSYLAYFFLLIVYTLPENRHGIIILSQIFTGLGSM